MLFVLVLALAGPEVDVWKAGDDGLTNRFHSAYLDALPPLEVKSGARLKATIEQIEPKKWKHLGDPVDSSEVSISFERDGATVKPFRCTFLDEDFRTCVERAVLATKRLAS